VAHRLPPSTAMQRQQVEQNSARLIREGGREDICSQRYFHFSHRSCHYPLLLSLPFTPLRTISKSSLITRHIILGKKKLFWESWEGEEADGQ
jgi:hypothetical protein